MNNQKVTLSSVIGHGLIKRLGYDINGNSRYFVSKKTLEILTKNACAYECKKLRSSKGLRVYNGKVGLGYSFQCCGNLQASLEFIIEGVAL